MKIVIAPDSFKESLSAPDAAAAIARGVRQA
ncbi:glycerate kinase, partial [Bordetella pertussis]